MRYAWYILSALHGLVDPKEVLRPYDVSLASLDTEARKHWGIKVSYQIGLAIPRGESIVVFAGEQYRRNLSLFGYAVTVPYAGLGIGKQLHELTERGAA